MHQGRAKLRVVEHATTREYIGSPEGKGTSTTPGALIKDSDKVKMSRLAMNYPAGFEFLYVYAIDSRPSRIRIQAPPKLACSLTSYRPYNNYNRD